MVTAEEQAYTDFYAELHTGTYNDRPVSHYVVDFPDRDTIRVLVRFLIGPDIVRRFSRTKMEANNGR